MERKAIEIMTQRATNIMQEIAEDIRSLMNWPLALVGTQREKEWERISKKYQTFALQNQLAPYDLDQFKEYVLQKKRNKLKEELMTWAHQLSHAIECDLPLEDSSDEDALLAIRHKHTLVVANLLIQFLYAKNVID